MSDIVIDDISDRSRRFRALWWAARSQIAIATLLLLPLPLLLVAYLLSGGFIGAMAQNESRDHVFLVTALLLRFLPIVIALTAVTPGYHARAILLYTVGLFSVAAIVEAGFVYAAIAMFPLFGPEDSYTYWYVAIPARVAMIGLAAYGSYQAYCLLLVRGAVTREIAGVDASTMTYPSASTVAQRLLLPALASLFAFNYESIFSGTENGSSLAGLLQSGFELLLMKPTNWAINLYASLSGMQSAPIGALEFLLPVVFFLLECAVVIAGWRFVSRVLRTGAERRLLRDGRPPVLLLRSFKDDPATVSPESLVQRLLLRKIRIEEVIAVQIARIGPFVAVGMPGERLPLLGAYRVYLDDDKWQHAVVGWLESSSVVVMVVGTTPWVKWELQQVQSMSLLGKLVMIFPPEPVEWQERWAVLKSCFEGSAWAAGLSQVASPSVRALRLLPQGQLLAVISTGVRQCDYELALQQALAGKH